MMPCTESLCTQLGLFTGVRGRGILGTSPLGGSRKSGMTMSSEARGARVGRTAQNSTHPI
jgi:hypothetical protein